MEWIQGKRTLELDRSELHQRAMNREMVLIDVGTGDGGYPLRLIRQSSAGGRDLLAVGIDACRENLRQTSRRSPPNVLFIIANALDLPEDLNGLATHVTINFPWGSLLAALLTGHERLFSSLAGMVRTGAVLELRLNGGAMTEQGRTLDVGVAEIMAHLGAAGFCLRELKQLDAVALRAIPTTWAKRLAFGRDRHAVYLRYTVPANTLRSLERYPR